MTTANVWFQGISILPQQKRLCGFRKYSYTSHGRSLEIPSGRGVLKAKLLEEKYESTLEIPGGGGEVKGY